MEIRSSSRARCHTLPLSVRLCIVSGMLSTSITPSLPLASPNQTIGPSASDKLDLQERVVFSDYCGNTLFRLTWEPKGRGCSGSHRPS